MIRNAKKHDLLLVYIAFALTVQIVLAAGWPWQW